MRSLCLFLCAGVPNLAIAIGPGNNWNSFDDDDMSSCQWTSSKATGRVSFDLSQLKVTSESQLSYLVDSANDEDFNYVWNVCEDVTEASIPSVCNGKPSAAAYQFVDGDNSGCYVIGKEHSATFDLLDEKDPSVGVSLTYSKGEFCTSKLDRETTIQVFCSNTMMNVVSALEPITCTYILSMESYYGCPTSCKVTAKGLCNSKGTCEYDSDSEEAYCSCDNGYSGDDCSEVSDSYQVTFGMMAGEDSEYMDFNTYSSQQLMVAFLAGCVLFGVIGFVAIKVRDRYSGGNRFEYQPIPQTAKDEQIISKVLI